jgi:hypothetical protein
MGIFLVCKILKCLFLIFKMLKFFRIFKIIFLDRLNVMNKDTLHTTNYWLNLARYTLVVFWCV